MATGTSIDALNNSTKKVHKAAEPSDQFRENNIADEIVKLKPVPDGNSRTIEKK